MIFLNVAYAIQPGSNIDMYAHLGGFIAGYAIGSTYLTQNSSLTKSLNIIVWGSMIAMFTAIYMIDLVNL